MKRIHIRKPDIKGGIKKIRNLKKEDIISYWKARREPRPDYRGAQEQRICPEDEAGLSVDEPALLAVSCSAGVYIEFCH